MKRTGKKEKWQENREWGRGEGRERPSNSLLAAQNDLQLPHKRSSFRRHGLNTRPLHGKWRLHGMLRGALRAGKHSHTFPHWLYHVVPPSPVFWGSKYWFVAKIRWTLNSGVSQYASIFQVAFKHYNGTFQQLLRQHPGPNNLSMHLAWHWRHLFVVWVHTSETSANSQISILLWGF